MIGDGYNNPLLQTLLLKCFIESQNIDAEVKARIFKIACEEYQKSPATHENTLLINEQTLDIARYQVMQVNAEE